ncbi:MAG: hypothetical protein GDA44_10230, partial [Prochloron sp. SP5CPC1]|nr:hypothetical protein [Candidatus Paraprochloron terpiosi SP5CPC1]
SPKKEQSSQSRYRLCGIDSDGNLWYRPCPSEQVAEVGMAIARSQKLKQLLKRQQDLDSRRSRLTESLVLASSTFIGTD